MKLPLLMKMGKTVMETDIKYEWTQNNEFL